MDLVEENFVVLHVFKHLDRHDEVVVFDDVEGTLVVGNVASYNGNVIDVVSPFFGGRKDIFSLGTAVGYSGDFGIWILFKKIKYTHTGEVASKLRDCVTNEQKKQNSISFTLSPY